MHRRQGALLAALLALAAPAAGAPRDELRDLKARIEALQDELQEAEASRSTAAKALAESERAIRDATRRLAALHARHDELAASLADLQTQARRLDGELRAQQARLADFLYRRYVKGRAEGLRLLLGGGDSDQVARELTYYGYLARARADALARLKESQARLSAVLAETEAQRAELAEVQAAQAAEVARIDAEKAARRDLLARATRQVETRRQEIGTLQQDENRLTRLVERIEKILREREAAERARRARQEAERKRAAQRAEAARRAGKRAESVAPKASEAPEPAPFAEALLPGLKGRLNLPVRGELANRFGSPRSDTGVLWKGLFILANPGETVKAVAAGRVVFANWLRGFGNLLIVDHGNAYMSLYGNNESLLKAVGDRVAEGDAVSTVGNSGVSNESGVYFEVRRAGKPVDPLSFVGGR